MLHLSWNNQEDRQKFSTIVASGRVIVGSTDTVIGLFAPLTAEGYAQLDDIKQRKNKPYLVIAGSVKKVLSFIDEHDHEKIESLASTYWPGPVTLICNAKKEVPSYIAPYGKIALRVPDNQYLQEVLQDCNGLFSTSANIAGQDIPASIDEIDEFILDRVAAVITRDDTGRTVPSMILDVTGIDIVEIRRG